MLQTLRAGRWSIALGIAIVASLALTWLAAPAPPPQPPAPGIAGQTCGEDVGVECRTGVVRIASADAQSRSLEISRLLPPGPKVAVLVGRNDGELAIAAGLATTLGGPLLVLPVAGLSTGISAELERLRPETIVVVGRPAETERVTDLLSGVADQLGGAEVVAVSGEDAPQISAAAARLLPRSVPVAYVVGDHDILAGLNIATLLAQAPGPVVVTPYAAATGDALAALTHLAPRRLVSIRGTNGFSLEVETTLVQVASGGRSIPVHRLGAVDPSQTAAQVAGRVPTGVSEAYLVPVSDAASVFSASAVAGRVGAPLFTTGFMLPGEVVDELDRLGPDAVVVAGTGAIIGVRTEAQIRELLDPLPR